MFFSRKDVESLIIFTINDFKLKYKNMLFGYFWSIINPLLMLLTLYVVFTYVMKMNIQYYQLFLLLGVICWNYFSEATTNSLNAITAYSATFKRHKLNPFIIIISSCLSSLINFFFSLIVFFIIAFYFKREIWVLGFFGIIYIFLLFFLSLGASLIITRIYLKFKDIKHIWSFLLLIGFWITPIIYSEMIIPEYIRRFYMINPLARIISQLRNLYIYDYFESITQIVITIIIIGIILIFGIFIFKKAIRKFAEES